MAVRDGMPYVGPAVESVLAQTFGDFELLIVDDGSTDGTVPHIASYKDRRIRVVCNGKNVGQTRSLNRGLALATGTYIARFDADDVCLPHRLERQVRTLDGRPDVAVVGARMYGMSSSGRAAYRLGTAVRDYATFVGKLLLGGCPVLHPTAMFRRAVVGEIGGYDERFAIGQDYDLWIRLATRRHNALVMREPLVKYRCHPGQQSVARRVEHRMEICLAHQEFVEKFCPSDQAKRVAFLLRADERFWDECRSKDDILVAVGALHGMLGNVQRVLRLSSEEFSTLKRVVYRRLGLGVAVAPRLARCPRLVFRGIFGVLSPVLIPTVRRALASAAAGVRHFRTVVG